jgi:excinuclease UvrABC nuclease subunit
MKYFKSIEELRSADTATIAEVPGITANVAENIHNFFAVDET